MLIRIEIKVNNATFSAHEINCVDTKTNAQRWWRLIDIFKEHIGKTSFADLAIFDQLRSKAVDKAN